ncbi:MAG: PilT/PilU family type 4a pilus ATPase, partial [Eubacteriales bacterium]
MSLIDDIIMYARENTCSDVHLTHELQPVLRKNGRIFELDVACGKEDVEQAIYSMMSKEHVEKLRNGEDADFCYTMGPGYRQRVNVYHQQGHLCAAIRILNDEIPTLKSLSLPAAIQELANKPSGLVLITGPTGSGKSTTLAAMIDHINLTRKGHILTFEDPIEYVHEHKKCIIHQREVGIDVQSFDLALKSALREDPDVILVGEMRDPETIAAAVTAAETGHLVLSTLHTTGAANTIDRIIDAFPEGAKAQIRTQLAAVLRGVVTQTLVPLSDGSGRCEAFEILLVNEAA